MSKYKKYWVGGAINLAANLGTAAYGAYQENKAKREMAQLDEQGTGAIRSEAARRRMARQSTDAQAATDAALRAEATAAQRLAEAGGAEALESGNPNLLRATDVAMQGALDKYGQTGADLINLNDQVNASTLDQRIQPMMNMLSQSAQAGAQTKAAGISGSLLGLAQLAGGLPKPGKPATVDPMTAPASKSLTPLPSVDAARQLSVRPSSSISTYDPSAGQLKLESKGLSSLAGPTASGTIVPQPTLTSQDAAFALQQQKELEKLLQPSEMGGFAEGGVFPKSEPEEIDVVKAMLRMVDYAKGKMNPGKTMEVEEEEVMETPGEFSHDTNPIDLVQDGEKIGEATGGEYIFNPEQAETLKQLAQEGDSELHQYLRELLSREEFNEEEDND